MHIDRIDWHHYDRREQRYVSISMPRVKWLELDPDYKPPRSPAAIKTDRRQDNRIGGVSSKPVKSDRLTFRPSSRSNELSPRQRQAWALYLANKTRKQIAEIMECTENAAAKLLSQAKEKLGIGLG